MAPIVHSPWTSQDRRPWTHQPDGHSYWVDVQPSSESLAIQATGTAEPKLVIPAESSEARSQRTVIRLRDYQIEAIDAVESSWKSDKKSPLVVLPTGCHRAGQGILMFDGSIKKVEDVEQGDLLMGPDSKPRTVLALCRGEGPMATVRPVKGREWTVNDEHVLSVVMTPTHSPEKAIYPSQVRSDALVDISVREYEAKSNFFKHRTKLVRCAVSSFGVQQREFPLDPYFFGLYMADGTLANESAEISKPDEEVRLECERQAAAHGLVCKNRNHASPDKCPTWAMVGSRGQKNPIIEKLRSLGVMPCRSEDRFVPNLYKLSSASDRLSFLAGIIDGDGHATNKGLDFISKSERLSNDVAFIARSVGLAAYVSGCVKHCQTGAYGDYWRVSITGETSEIPNRIARKSSGARLQKKDALRTGFKVVRTGTVEPYFGFVLDGDHRYLLDDFTVTHNSGKTILAAETIHRFCTANPMSSALFVAHRKELLEQTRGKIVAVSDKVSVGVVQAKTNQLGRKATVASIQTIGHSSGARLADLMQHGPIGLVIVDEAHHAISGSMYDRVIRRLREVNPGLVIMGITATPGRADGTGLDTMFDSIAYERDIFWMIDNGWLVPPTGVQVPINIDLDQVATRDGDYVESQLAKVMDQEPVRQAIVRAWMQHGQDRKMLVFCVNVAHAQSLAQDFCDAGYAAGCVWGAMPDAERERTLNDFRLGKLKLLCNVGVLTEGYDDPSCEGILFARPTQSQGLYLQVVGRALRLYPGKTEALIIDCVGNSERHSPVQLATLAGLSAPGTPAELEEGEEEEGNSPEDEEELVVNDADSGSGRIIDFQARARRRTQKYAWRESSAGWQLSVPGLGYFLVGWMDATKTKSSVFFYDQRPSRKSDHPIRLTTRALDFDLAYGMVESEMDRLVYAMTSRRGSSPLGGGESATPSDSEGPVEGEWIQKIRDNGQQELPTVQEHMVRSDAAWRSKPPTERQIEQFRRAKGKKAKLPSTAGEMSDALSAVFTERDLKKREPATAGQLRYLHVLGAPTHNGITKGEAARLIAQYGGSR